MRSGASHAALGSPAGSRARALVALLSMLTLSSLFALARADAAANKLPVENPRARLAQRLPLEYEGDPPGVLAKAVPGAGIASTIAFGRFTSTQVNVQVVLGADVDIVGDAANEPSLAVDPTNHNRMVIGWRQFDTITSNFRQAGFGYTTNGGLHWTAGKIQPGIFRSDPVLDVDAAGAFFYNSLTTSGGITSQVFRSNSGGATWGAPVFAFGGDKQWMAVDRTGGQGNGQLYQVWSTAANTTAPNTFNRSVDNGASFQTPAVIPNSPIWGTLDVSSDGTVYVIGGDGNDLLTNYVARSTNARDRNTAPPTFTSVPVNMGGLIRTGPPNPAGLLGQLGVAVDRSNGSRAGWIYALGSVETPTDPLDVNFVRSTDGGVTWSAPVRVNDDPVGNRAFQWFGTMSVAPSGRIDVVWNDTRGSADSTVSALYYAYSSDGGSTWSANEQASPTWSSMVGFPNQQKIGDYYDMTSDNDGADLAYAATFNGGQDIYYLRIPSLVVTGVAGDPTRRSANLTSEPNPISSSARLRFNAPSERTRVRLEIFDIGGQRVTTLLDGFRSGAGQEVRWSGRNHDGAEVAPGVYFCRLEMAGQSDTRRLVRIR